MHASTGRLVALVVLISVLFGCSGEKKPSKPTPGLRTTRAPTPTLSRATRTPTPSPTITPARAAHQPGAVRMRCRDAANAAIPGVTVSLLRRAGSSSSPQWEPVAVISTNTDGIARFADLSPGIYLLQATDPAWRSEASRLLRLGPGSPDIEVDLVLFAGSRIHGQLVDETALRPVIGATVTVTLEDVPLAGLFDPHGRLRRWTAVSDSEGTFAVNGLFEGLPYCVSVLSDSQTIHSCGSVLASATAPTRFLVPATGLPGSEAWPKGAIAERPNENEGFPLAGMVTNKTGSGVVGAEVSTLPGAIATLTDAGGAFRLEGLPEGSVQLLCRADGYSPLVVSEAAAGRMDHRLTLQRAAIIGGRVLDAQGRPVAGVLVSVSSRFDEPSRTWSDQDGAFRLHSVPLDATRVVAWGCQGDRWFSAHYDLPALATEQQIADIELCLVPTFSVTGAVRQRSTKQPVAGVRLRVAAGAFAARSDAGGHFKLDGVPEGTWALEYDQVPDPWLPKVGQVQISVHGHLDQIDILLEMGRRVEGMVVGPQEEPVGEALVVALFPSATPYQTRSSADGTFVFSTLPDGPCTILAGKPSFAPSWPKEITLEETNSERHVLVLRSAGRASGAVRYDDGDPAPGAQVRWQVPDTLVALAPDYSKNWLTNAGGEGEYVLSDLPEGSVLLSAEVADTAGIVVRATQAAMIAAGHEATGVDFLLPRTRSQPLAWLTGRVIGEASEPVAGVRVVAQSLSSGGSNETTSAPDGTFRVENLIPGPYRLLALLRRTHQVATFPAGTLDVTAPADNLVLAIRAGGKITGHVRMAGSAEPVRDFEVGVLAHPGAAARYGQRVVGSSDGAFLLADVATGNWFVFAAVEGYPLALSEAIFVEQGKTTSGVEIQIRPGGGITGIVVNEDDHPIADAVLTCVAAYATALEGNGPSATSGTDGRFQILDVPAGSLWLHATHPQYAETMVTGLTVPAGEVLEDVRVELVGAGTIEGHVLQRDGAPAPGRRISINSPMLPPGIAPQPVTDANGYYVRGNLPAGEYAVALMSEDGASNTPISARSVSLQVGETQVVDFGLGGVRLFGSVTRQGEPVGQVVLQLLQAADGGFFRTAADVAGNYEIEGLLPGEHRVDVLSVQQSTVLHSGRFDIPSDVETFRYDIALPAGVINGRVFRADNGEPAPGATVVARLEQPADIEQATPGLAGSAVAAADGGFAIAGLPAGQYSLAASHKDHGAARDTVTLGADEVRAGVELELSPIEKLRITLTDARSGAGIRGTIFVRAEDGTDAAGPSDIRPAGGTGRYEVNLRPGPYAVYAMSLSGYVGQIQSVDVRAGEPNELAFPLQPGTLVHFQVLDSQGKPIPSLTRLEVQDADGPLDGLFVQTWMGMAVCVVRAGPCNVTVAAPGCATVSQPFDAPPIEPGTGLSRPHTVTVTLPAAP